MSATKLEMLDKVREICIGLNISDQLEFVLGNNPSNDLPYHNLTHTLSMVLCCYEAGTHYNLPLVSLRPLCVAALFHDYDHSGGAQSDSANISNAISGFLHQNCLNSFPWYTEYATQVPRFIAVTEYPYVLSPVCIEERILRDCDLLSIIYDDWYDRIIIGLGMEMSVKYGRTVTEYEMVKGQIDFLGSVKLFTDWGRSLFFSIYNDRIAFLNSRLSELTAHEASS